MTERAMEAVTVDARRVVTPPLDEAAMTALARGLARHIEPPLVLYFEGDLGAGKTTFIRALVQALGHEGRVKSPTYGLLEHYPLADLEVLHLDLYRIGDPGELEFLGITDLFDERTVLLVEWPAQGLGALPPADAVLRFEPGVGNSLESRRLTLYAHSRSGNALCEFFDSLL